MEKKNTHWEEDPRFKQCNQELFIILMLFLFNIVLVIGGSTLLGHGVAGENMTMVFGFPAWFFWGGLVSTLVFCLASIIVVRLFFKDMSLDSDDQEEVER